MNSPTSSPAVLVAVGTDKHPFDRLFHWLERWYERRADRPRLVVQFGSSRPPGLPGTVQFLDHSGLIAAMAAATLVVTHAGPATLTEARRAGHLPIVVARDPRHGEHVDDHQLLFARRLARAGMIKQCGDSAELAAAIEAGLAEPDLHQLGADPADGAARAQAVHRVGQIVERLVRQHADNRHRTGFRWRSR